MPVSKLQARTGTCAPTANCATLSLLQTQLDTPLQHPRQLLLGCPNPLPASAARISGIGVPALSAEAEDQNERERDQGAPIRVPVAGLCEGIRSLRSTCEGKGQPEEGRRLFEKYVDTCEESGQGPWT